MCVSVSVCVCVRASSPLHIGSPPPPPKKRGEPPGQSDEGLFKVTWERVRKQKERWCGEADVEERTLSLLCHHLSPHSSGGMVWWSKSALTTTHTIETKATSDV